MAHYFTDTDEETRAMINELIKPLDPVNRIDYLINCLVPKHRQHMTVKEVLADELKAKKDFEESLEGRSAKIAAPAFFINYEE